MTGKFYGIGLGPGDSGLVTLKAAAALRRVNVIFSAGSRQSERSVSGGIIAALEGVTARQVGLSFPMGLDWSERREQIRRHAAAILAELDAGNDCAFVTIGDALTYSTCGYLLRELRALRPGLDAEIIPGVNSWSALAAAAQQPLVEDRERLCIVPGYVAPEAEELDRLLGTRQTVVLLKTYRSRGDWLKLLRERGTPFLYGANLGLPDEFIADDPEAVAARAEEYLSMLVLQPDRNAQDA